MLPELQAKADQIADNFSTIKTVAFFSKKTVLEKLRKETGSMKPEEIKEVTLYLMQILSKPDFKLFFEYLQIALGKK